MAKIHTSFGRRKTRCCIKDHMRGDGMDVSRADILQDNTGLVEYRNADDMERAVRKVCNVQYMSWLHKMIFLRFVLRPFNIS